MFSNISLKHLTLRLLPESLLQPLRKAHYARKLQNEPREPEMDIIPHLLPAGGIALDLGANFGLYTRFLSETVGLRGHVHAVEPVPSTFDVLESNVRKLGIANVTVHNVAITDCERLATMAIPTYAEGGENLYEARIIDSSTGIDNRTVSVQALPLDQLFGRLGRIDFIKCDVEGHELSVLRGATEILRVHRSAWLMEVSGSPDVPESTAAEVVRLMTRAGYRMYQLDQARARCNWFFLRSEHVRKLSTIMS